MVTSKLKNMWRNARSDDDWDDEEDYYEEDQDSTPERSPRRQGGVRSMVDPSGYQLNDAASQGILSDLNISIESQVNEDVLSSREMRSVRFRTAKPEGYYFEDVDQAVEKFTFTVTELEKALYSRDKDVHKLATQIDDLQTTLENLRNQLEVYQAKGQILVDDEGNPIVVKGDARIEDIDELHRKINDLTSLNLTLEKQLHSLELKGGAAPIATATNSDEGGQKVAQLVSENQQLQDYVTQQQEWIEAASVRLEELTAALDQATAEGSESAESTNPQPQGDTPGGDVGVGHDVEALEQAHAEEVQRLTTTIDELQNWIDQASPIIEEMEKELQDYRNAPSVAVSAETPAVSAEAERVAELEAWAEDAVKAFADMEEERARISEALEEAYATVDARDAYIAQLQGQLEDFSRKAEERVATTATAGEVESGAPEVAALVEVEQEVKEIIKEIPAPEEYERYQASEGVDIDKFREQLEQMNRPESALVALGGEEFLRKRPRGGRSYAPASPGAPLTTIPEGADPADYL